MNGLKFDILIVCHEKDANKLNYLIPSIEKNIKEYKDIIVVSNKSIFKKDFITKHKVFSYLDEDVFNFNMPEMHNGRTGWYKQQFIKLFQTVTSDRYLVIDADVIFLNPIEIFFKGKPNFLLGKNQYHKSYFNKMDQIAPEYAGLHKFYNNTFINEIMLFDRVIIKELVKKYGYMNNVHFMQEVCKIVNTPPCHKTSNFSEYEMYGNYVTLFHPNMYNYKYIKCGSVGKRSNYTHQEVKNHISNFKQKGFDKIVLHTWT